MSAWLRIGYILAGVGAYLFWAALTLVITRRTGSDLTKVENRTSVAVLSASVLANALVLSSVLLLTAYLMKSPLTVLGFRFSGSDAALSAIGLALTVLTAVGFLYSIRGRGVRVAPIGMDGRMILGLGVLLIVAAQEEILYRGYVAQAMQGTGDGPILVVTTILFVVIHFLTNRVTAAQIMSWTLSGFLLGLSFVLSRSIWVPIILHFAIDSTNVLVFRITGREGLFATEPPISERERAAYRLIYGAILAALLLLWYLR